MDPVSSDYAFLIMSVLSVVGSILLAYSFIFIRPLNNVFWMSLSDLFLAVMFFGTFMHPFASLSPLKKTDWWCHFSFILDQFFGPATVLWYTMVALNTWLAIRGINAANLKSLMKYQHILCWGYSLAITIPPLVFQSYWPMPESYCWFQQANDPWRLTFYIPILISLCFCLFLFVYAILAYTFEWHVFQNRKVAASAYVVLLRIGFIVVVYVVFWSVALVGRLQNYFYGTDRFQYHLVSLTSSGFCNFVVWGISSPKILQLWSRCVHWGRVKATGPVLDRGVKSDIELDEWDAKHDADLGETDPPES